MVIGVICELGDKVFDLRCMRCLRGLPCFRRRFLKQVARAAVIFERITIKCVTMHTKALSPSLAALGRAAERGAQKPAELLDAALDKYFRRLLKSCVAS